MIIGGLNHFLPLVRSQEYCLCLSPVPVEETSGRAWLPFDHVNALEWLVEQKPGGCSMGAPLHTYLSPLVSCLRVTWLLCSPLVSVSSNGRLVWRPLSSAVVLVGVFSSHPLALEIRFSAFLCASSMAFMMVSSLASSGVLWISSRTHKKCRACLHFWVGHCFCNSQGCSLGFLWFLQCWQIMCFPLSCKLEDFALWRV